MSISPMTKSDLNTALDKLKALSAASEMILNEISGETADKFWISPEVSRALGDLSQYQKSIDKLINKIIQ